MSFLFPEFDRRDMMLGASAGLAGLAFGTNQTQSAGHSQTGRRRSCYQSHGAAEIAMRRNHRGVPEHARAVYEDNGSRISWAGDLLREDR